MRDFDEKRKTENKFTSMRLKKATSILSKDLLMSQANATMRHGQHISRFGKNIRQFDSLPKILAKKGWNTSGSEASLTLRYPEKLDRS